jgi:dipeptidyl aminopeptidase/acylaminoacyl peptidase
MQPRSFIATLILSLAGLTHPVVTDARPTVGTLLSTEPVELPAYGEVADLHLYATPAEYERAVNDRAFCLHKLWYRSDGLRVAAYLYAPCETAGLKLPAIVFDHGGFAGGDPAATLLPAFHRFAEAGFVVLAPLYRGNAGAEGRDEMGGADLDDVMTIPAVATELGFVDIHNLFLAGESRGGMMAYQAIREGFPANAAAVYGAFTSLGDLIASKPDRYEPILHVVWPDYDADSKAILHRRSALEWSKQLDIPLLIMHGGADESVDPMQSLRLAMALQESGSTYSLLIYAGDNHVLTRHHIQRDQNEIDWFKAHLAK